MYVCGKHVLLESVAPCLLVILQPSIHKHVTHMCLALSSSAESIRVTRTRKRSVADITGVPESKSNGIPPTPYGSSSLPHSIQLHACCLLLPFVPPEGGKWNAKVGKREEVKDSCVIPPVAVCRRRFSSHSRHHQGRRTQSCNCVFLGRGAASPKASGCGCSSPCNDS